MLGERANLEAAFGEVSQERVVQAVVGIFLWFSRVEDFSGTLRRVFKQGFGEWSHQLALLTGTQLRILEFSHQSMGIVICWGLLGPVLGYSDKWQLVINISTTTSTFL